MNPNIEQRPLVSDQIDQLPEKPWVRGQQQNALTGGLSLVKQVGKNNNSNNTRLEAELRKAEFINSQLLVSQKKKEQMIAVLMEENKNMKEKLLKTQNDLQRRMSQAKIFRDILQKIGVLQKGDKPQTPEEGQMYLNKFIKYIEDEDHRQKTIFKRRGYHNQSTVEFQFKSSSIDEKGTFSSNLSSTDNNRPENALRASQKIKQLTRYKKKDTMQQQEKLRQPPVFEALHRKSKCINILNKYFYLLINRGQLREHSIS